MIDIAYKIAAFLVTLGVLVVFHELGHYVVARWCGVKVLRFSVGFGRIVASRKAGPDADRVGGVGDPAWRLRQDGRRARRRCRAGGLSACLQSPERLEAHRHRRRRADRQSAAGGRALHRHVHGRHSGAACGDRRARVGLDGRRRGRLRGGDLVVALDGVPVQSWQDLRWRLLRAQDRDDGGAGGDAERCARGRRAGRAHAGR